MWRDTGIWIALGISALFVVVAFVMHRVFLKILTNGSVEPSTSPAGQTQSSSVPTPLESHE